MARLTWNAADERFFEAGIDRGVLYPNGGFAIPWNGLTGVDETGSDGATPYFIDGRPYLIFTKPKEYEASIKAFTYPDAFAAALGLTEADEVDGMFLDSQSGDSFGFSYRTKIGNGIDGIDHSYKVHIVYNATVSQDSISYETLSNSVNPIEFNWAIKAVPVPIEGYRPTAHIVMNTKFMDPETIVKLEDLLYGTSSQDAVMPQPTDLIELLSFGTTVTITDNGDGTWSAQGAHSRIYATSTTTFRVEDMNAVDNGNGTFDISTTTT